MFESPVEGYDSSKENLSETFEDINEKRSKMIEWLTKKTIEFGFRNRDDVSKEKEKK